MKFKRIRTKMLITLLPIIAVGMVAFDDDICDFFGKYRK